MNKIGIPTGTINHFNGVNINPKYHPRTGESSYYLYRIKNRLHEIFCGSGWLAKAVWYWPICEYVADIYFLFFVIVFSLNISYSIEVVRKGKLRRIMGSFQQEKKEWWFILLRTKGIFLFNSFFHKMPLTNYSDHYEKPKYCLNLISFIKKHFFDNKN